MNEVQKKQEELYELLCNLHEQHPEFTFWPTQGEYRFNRGSDKEGANLNNKNAYTNVGIVMIGSGDSYQLVGFHFTDGFAKCKLQVANRFANLKDKSKTDKRDDRRPITVRYNKKFESNLTENDVQDFIDFLDKECKEKIQEKIIKNGFDTDLGEWIINTYFSFFDIVKEYDDKKRTNFGKLLRIGEEVFSRKKKNSDKKRAELEDSENNPEDTDNIGKENVKDDQDVKGTGVIPLNQILYGPPGTGKTYNTLFRALSIIEGNTIEELENEKKKQDDIWEKDSNNPKKGKKGYEVLKERYDDYENKGQIVFTTFHQSMSYEDFIEGIKPVPVDDEIVAIHEINDKNATKITQFGDGTTTISNLSRMKYEVKDGIFKKLCDIRAFLKDAKNKNVQFDLENGDIFTIDKIEEAIVYCKNSQSGEVPAGIEEIFTLLKKNNKPKQEEEQKQEQSHLFAIAIVKKFLEKKKVIIIDEINRGNVAQIFGELITLIEDNKRLGNDEAMTAALPYSQKPFGVPNNLYIIGTMNTADRSVEALDTALRRRFSFVEMMPDPELLKDKDRKYLEVCGIKLSDLLKTINARITVLKDREHQIGHSYYMKCKTWKDLKDAFKKEIIPLLQEYFYGNYESIRLVLGEGFVVKETEKVIFAGGQAYDGDSDKTRYRLLTESEWVAMDENKLKNAIEKLLNKTNNLDAPDGTSSNL